MPIRATSPVTPGVTGAVRRCAPAMFACNTGCYRRRSPSHTNPKFPRTDYGIQRENREVFGRVHKSRDLRDLDRGHKDTPGDTFWLAGIYFLVHAIFVASKLWIWQQFRKIQ